MTSLAPVDIVFNSGEVSRSPLVTGNTDNPVFTLVPPIENCVGVSVTYVNVPFTYYVIDQTNNQFQFLQNGVNPTVITLDSGSYNAVNICTQIKSKLIAAGIVRKFEIFVDSTTSQLVMYRTDGVLTDTFDMRFDGTKELALARILGFTQRQSNNSFYINVPSVTTPFVNDNDVTVTGTSNLAGSNIISLTGENDMYLDSDLSSAIFGSVRNQAGNKGLLGFWRVNCNYQGTIDYENYNPVMIPMTSSEISRISLSLILGNRTSYKAKPSSELTSYLQLNGEAFQVGLRFWKKINQGEEHSDNVGNRTIAVGSTAGRIYDPKNLKRKDVSGPQRKVMRM